MSDLAFLPRPAEGLSFANAIQMFRDRVRRSPNDPAIRHKHDGIWNTLSWQGLERSASEFAAGLFDWRKVERGERVAILATNQLGWLIADLAVAMLGAVSVPLDANLRGANLANVLRASGSRIVVVAGISELRRVRAVLQDGEVTGLDGAVVLGEENDDPELPSLPELPARTLEALQEMGAQVMPTLRAHLDRLTDTLAGTDPFTVIYPPETHGTKPKGVVLCHRNIGYETWALRNVIAVDQADEHLLVLPLYHAFGRHLVWAAYASGAVTAVMDPALSVMDNLRQIAPTFLGAAPPVYEAIRRRILAEVRSAGPVRVKLFAWCLDVGRQVSGHKQRGESVPGMLAVKQAAADRLVFGEIQRQLGGRLRFLVSGGSPARVEVLEFFHAVGLLILEGYGLTETSGATNVNRPDRYRFGTVGPALPGCEVLIASDGEILIRGHNVMLEYDGHPDATRVAIDGAGWLHTGDIGAMEHGFLRVVGRKHEVIELAGGRCVHPEPIETALRAHPDVGHVVLCGGRDRPDLAALITLEDGALARLAERAAVRGSDRGPLTQHPRIRRSIEEWVARVNQGLDPENRVGRFALLLDGLGSAPGEDTGTLPPRRHAIYRRFRTEIDAMYAISQPRTGTTASDRDGKPS
ncbi:MAG: AMP-binding protein [Nannocystaceae bacterium]